MVSPHPQGEAERVALAGGVRWLRGETEQAAAHVAHAAGVRERRASVDHEGARSCPALPLSSSCRRRHERALAVGQDALALRQQLGLTELAAHLHSTTSASPRGNTGSATPVPSPSSSAASRWRPLGQTRPSSHAGTTTSARPSLIGGRSPAGEGASRRRCASGERLGLDVVISGSAAKVSGQPRFPKRGLGRRARAD